MPWLKARNIWTWFLLGGINKTHLIVIMINPYIYYGDDMDHFLSFVNADT